MPRKSYVEDTVLSYFNDAPLPYAEIMLRLASGAVRRRRRGPQAGQIDVRKARKQGDEKPDASRRLAPQPV